MRPFIALSMVMGYLTAYGQVLKVKDISPDGSDFTYVGQIAPGGRVKSLVIDPTNDGTLYAAGEFGGVWKTTTGLKSETGTGMKWFQANKGLRSGLTVNQYSLAVDASNPNRLLYATGDDDGRPVTASGAHPKGGLWFSLDSAGSWHHAKLCPSNQDDGLSSVAFSSGRPFAVTNCGIWTNSTATLASSSWKLLTGVPTGFVFPFGAGAYLVDGTDVLFACIGTQAFRSLDQGGSWDVMSLKGPCRALAAVPHPGATAFQVVVVRSPGAGDKCVTTSTASCQEVTVVDFSAATTQDLGFSTVATYGSGASATATIQNPSLPLLVPIPGDTYDLYAADGLQFYEYSPTAPHWKTASSIHVDTWGMVFPSWYDPTKGVCAAYAANDGGVYFNFGSPGQTSLLGGGCANAGWKPEMDGLHAMEATTVTAITSQSAKYASSKLPLAIYMPTGDNDTFVRDLGTCPAGSPGSCTFPSKSWENFNSLGDSGQALVDAAFPEQVLLSRNCNYETFTNPPDVGGTFAELIPAAWVGCPSSAPAWFVNGYQAAGTGGLTQVMSTPAELASPVSHGDYIAVQDLGPQTCNSIQQVVRNISNPPAAPSWFDLSPSDHFLSCNIGKIQAAGGHGSGLVVYVLTTLKGSPAFPSGRSAGQIYRGVVTGTGIGSIASWTAASGTSAHPLGSADNFYVNPFDATELYAVDVAGQAIMTSRDSGSTWSVDRQLTSIATNLGEYAIGCNEGRRGVTGSEPFANGCSISWMGFDVFHPNIRVVAAGYGGIAFSRDHGHHWMALDVTNNNHTISPDLTQRVSGVFYDGETSFPNLTSGGRIIYAGLKGQSLIQVEGPFPTLEALEFSWTPTVSPITSVVVNVSTTGQSIHLRKDVDGVYRGAALFDSKIYTTTLFYSLTVDGVLFTTTSYTLTATDISNGVATAPPL